MADEALICAWCDEALDDEQAARPERNADGEIICDDCYQETYRDECLRCGHTVDKGEMGAKAGEEIAVLRTAPGLASDLHPGYYRVKRWPFFADGVITGYFYDTHLEYLRALDEAAQRAAEHTESAAIPLCAACRSKVTDAPLLAEVDESGSL